MAHAELAKRLAAVLACRPSELENLCWKQNNEMDTACEPSGKLCKSPDLDSGTLNHECPLEANLRAND